MSKGISDFEIYLKKSKSSGWTKHYSSEIPTSKTQILLCFKILYLRLYLEVI